MARVKNFQIVRVGSPKFDERGPDYELFLFNRSYEALGDQPDFGWALAAPFRALANPLAPAAFPRKPDKTKDFSGAIAYWHSLQHLLLYRLGWSHPGKGMAELLDGWFPLPDGVADDTIQLIHDVWFRDGTLHHFVAWALQRPDSYHSRRQTEWAAQTVIDLDALGPSYDVVSPAGLHLEAIGGHYFHHEQSDQSRSAMVRVISHEPGDTSAVIVIEAAYGWYEALCRAGEHLLARTDEYVTVDVYVKSIGFMGSYRHSQITGLWFTGREDVHMFGNVVDETSSTR